MGSDDVFGDGAHVVKRIGRFDEDRHFLELVGDGALDTAPACDDGEGAVFLLGEERGLDEPDCVAVGFEGGVGQAIGRDLPRVSSVDVNQGLGVDDAQFDCLFHDLLLIFWVRQFSRTANPGARARGRGKGGATRRDSDGPAKRPAEPTLCGGARPCSVVVFLGLLSSIAVLRPGSWRGAQRACGRARTGRASAAWAKVWMRAISASEQGPLTSRSTQWPPLPTWESRRRWLEEV